MPRGFELKRPTSLPLSSGCLIFFELQKLRIRLIFLTLLGTISSSPLLTILFWSENLRTGGGETYGSFILWLVPLDLFGASLVDGGLRGVLSDAQWLRCRV